MQRRPDRLLRFILGWTCVTLLFSWLPLIRGAMDGASYIWGASYFDLTVGGSGVGGQYWLLVIQCTVAISILALGWRGARPPFHPLLLLWHGVLAASSAFAAWKYPENYRFRGDTLGIDVSLAWLGPALFGGFFLLAALWCVMDLRRIRIHVTPTWSRVNSIWVTLLAGLLPLQFVLLRFGEPHGLTDKIGVVLTIAQCLLLGRIFRPASKQFLRRGNSMLTAAPAGAVR